MADTPDPALVVVETEAPKVDPETGVAMHGDYPLNLRLRAEALAKEGRTDDPDGLVAPELIEDTAARVTRENAQAEANTPSMDWTRAELVAHAEGLSLTIDRDATKAAILDAINAAPAAQ